MVSELEWLPQVAEQCLTEGEQKDEKGFLLNFLSNTFSSKANRLLKSSDFQAVFENNSFKYQSRRH